MAFLARPEGSMVTGRTFHTVTCFFVSSVKEKKCMRCRILLMTNGALKNVVSFFMRLFYL